MDEVMVKRVVDCSLAEVIEVWNKGFEGYMVDVTMTPMKFLKRVANEDLDVERSIILFHEDKPVAIVMNAFREINGKKFAWNGGTGIVKDWRGKGISKKLMEEVDRVYQEENVNVARLEAISTNERAIKLYENHGYSIIEHLDYRLGPEDFIEPSVGDEKLNIVRVPKEEVMSLPFYNQNLPWQNQSDSLSNGYFYLLYQGDKVVGYAATRETFQPSGELAGIQLYQSGLKEKSPELAEHCLYHLFRLDQSGVKRMLVNFPVETYIDHALKSLNFKPLLQQVHMEKHYS